ncbi:flagellar hook protein FlgE [Aminobacter sp. NyZ550]|jgi:flagellar hook protein FlgE|uniref:Flagellar hook protein FlgE n=2 Tax=Aminobacter TaxID=31988 RepID=A0AAC9AQZ4_AMIAI|nr:MULTISPECIES: flagellar hook protein FlgE [Aminobacter]AMS41012.1 Flagellar hook protein FlgE [Aminobacter aminovorans]MBA8909517.1 flagellar hook protein FlgE [Aminobacter ciceronei]MBA9023288.1 flagellar hook protein FlgE [Aminobacter ciceronei]MBB3706010.1 flagellar hook protein FlgE [Aminobacter aminovorans]MRX35720.1 flagellar hook-basal body complex protein [Aminobacter sp. MDW-2]
MSLYGMMRTGVSGMNAQANRLSTVADNIANSSTTGYKRAYTEFSSLVLPSTPGAYNSGGVTTKVLNAVAKDGTLQYTTSGTDLAVQGNGFFVVQDASGSPYLTRAGSFVPDGQGRLINAAGYQLMGYSYANGIPAATANGFDGLVPVQISSSELTALPTKNATFTANLQSDAAVSAGPLPSTNAAGATYTSKSSMVMYDNLGAKKIVDIYYTKTGANTWDVAVYDQSKAAAGTSFPYAAGGLLTNSTMTFDGTTGKLTSAGSLSFTVPNGAPVTLDISKMTQLASPYTVTKAVADGNGPSTIERVEIDTDGTMYAQYADGSMKPLFKIPLADVASPDRLNSLSGNVFRESADSGPVQIGFADSGGLGKMISGALENSNVDIAEELTAMIESQRNYTANSKVFQTGADLMDILVNLKR